MVKNIKNKTATDLNPTDRFSERVEDYHQFRPSYPKDVLKFLVSDLNLSPQLVVADIGIGTGKFTEILLNHGNKVFGVEPNQEMREQAEKNLKHYTTFSSVNGTAESTQLPSESVNLITAAHAFHWFDQGKAKTEFQRILSPNSYVLLLWNLRSTDHSPFSAEFEQFLLTFGIEYEAIKESHNPTEEKLQQFYDPNGFQERLFFHEQKLNSEALTGLVCSFSYMPQKHHPQFSKMVKALNRIFEKFEKQGYVTLPYETKLVWGNLT